MTDWIPISSGLSANDSNIKSLSSSICADDSDEHIISYLLISPTTHIPMASKRHPSLSLPFSTRAEQPNPSPLATYLLSLISIKRSNLCVSADVHTTYDLLSVAEEVGDHICVLKTHADIIDDWSRKTIAGLQEISRRKRFLLFEDRKLGDIGSRS